MNKLIIFVLLLCIAIVADVSAQFEDAVFEDSGVPSKSRTKIIKFKVGDLYGFKYEIGDTIIPPVYDFLHKSRDDGQMILAKKEGKSGSINLNNEVIIPLVYDEVKWFSTLSNHSRKTVFVRDGNIFHLKDTFGKDIISDKKGFYKPTGSFLLVKEKNNTKSVYNFQGEKLIDSCYNLKKVIHDEVEYIAPALESNGTLKLGLFDSRGKLILEPKFNKITSHSKGLILSDSLMKYLFDPITQSKRYIGEYEYVVSFDSGSSVIRKDNNYGMLNSDFNITIPIIYNDIEFINPYCYFIKKTKEITVTDHSGNLKWNKACKDYEFLSIGFLMIKDINDNIELYDERLNQVHKEFSSFMKVTNQYQNFNMLLGKKDNKYSILKEISTNHSEQFYHLKQQRITRIDSLADVLFLLTTEKGIKYTYPTDSNREIPYLLAITKLVENYFLCETINRKFGVIRGFSNVIVPYNFDKIEIVDDTQLSNDFKEMKAPIFRAIAKNNVYFYDKYGNSLPNFLEYREK